MGTAVFGCSTCGKQFRVAPEQAGRKVRCPHCETPNSVPDNVFAPVQSAVFAPETQQPLDELSAAVEQAPQPPAPAPPRLPPDIRTSGKAITALILGILAFLSFGILGIPAVVLGAVAVREINRSDGVIDGKGMAIWGIVLGGIGVTALVVYAILILFFAATSPLSPFLYRLV